MACSERESPARKTRRASNGIRDQLPVPQLQTKCLFEQLCPDLDQRGRALDQLRDRQAAVTVARCFRKPEGQPGAQPDDRLLLDPGLCRNLIGRPESDAANIPGKPIGVLGDEGDRLLAIGLENLHGAGRADAMGAEEQRDLANGLLVGPAGYDAGRSLCADHLPELVRLLLDKVEHRFPEGLHQGAGIGWTDAADHAGAEVFFDTLQGRRLGGGDVGRLEQQSMFTVIHPDAHRADEFAGADDGRMARQDDQVPLPACLDPEDAEMA